MVHIIEAPFYPFMDPGQSGTLIHFPGISPKNENHKGLLNCIQRDDESLSDYLERLIQIKAQVPNAPEETVIAAAVEGPAAVTETRRDSFKIF